MKTSTSLFLADRSKILPIILVAGILFVIYSNSFNAGWQMDDRPNIVNNMDLHIENLMPASLWQTFFANQGRETPRLFRPVACLTFALNWYVGQDDTLGYHIVNFGFHFGTAAALYFLFLRLLARLYQPREHEWGYIGNIALLAVVLWAVHPIQTQAVTYIVQRMAVMAAFFYVLSMLYYVKARTSVSARERWVYSLLCMIWFFCALGSKENAITLPVAIVLIEWVFFQKGRTDFLRWPVSWVVAAGVASAGIIIFLVYTGGTPIETMRAWYTSRPFSLEERLLAQPRVILLHLSQLFYPLPERFSIAHDITLSPSLFYPWTTLPAIIAIIGMIAGAFVVIKRYPLITFAILFFFMNHVIESSVLPLEIVFEHRNYLPSLFLFLPIAAGLCSLLMKLRQDNRVVYGIMAMAIAFMIASVGLSTYTRNEAWATSITLWSDAAQKAPNHVRPIVTLGVKLAWQDNPTDADYNFALRLFRHALELPDAARKTEKSEILGNIASIYYHRGEHDRAIATYMEALEVNPLFLKNRSDLLKPLIMKGDFEEAKYHAAYLVWQRPNNHNYLSMNGFILLWQNDPGAALPFFQKALEKGPHRPNLLLNTGVALTQIDSLENGRWFLQQSIRRSRGDLLPLLAMIENRARAEEHAMAKEYARHAVSAHPVPVIYHRLAMAETDYSAAPISSKLIEPYIKQVVNSATTRMQ